MKSYKNKTAVRVLLAALTLTSSSVYSQDRVQNGGEVAGKILRDLTDNTVCTWVTPKGMQALVANELNPIMNAIRLSAIPAGDDNYTLMSLFSGLRQQLFAMSWCQTEAPLFRVDTQDVNSVVTAYEGKTTQVAIRVGDRVFLDMVQFRKMTPRSQAFLLIHEALHNLVLPNSMGHNSQVRSITSSVDKFTSGRMNRPDFIFNLNANGLEEESETRSILYQFYQAGTKAREFFKAGVRMSTIAMQYSLVEMKKEGFRAVELYNDGDGFKPSEISTHYTFREARAHGETLSQLTPIYTSAEIRANYPVKEARAHGETLTQLSSIYTWEELIQGGYSRTELIQFYKNDIKKLLQKGCVASEFKSAGISIRKIVDTVSFKISDLLGIGYSLAEIRAAYPDLKDFSKLGSDVKTMLAVGFTIRDICNLGPSACVELSRSMPLSLFHKSGVRVQYLFKQSANQDPCYSLKDFMNAGFSKEEIILANTTASHPFPLDDMKNSGFTASELKGYYGFEKLAGYFTEKELLAAGFSKEEIKENNKRGKELVREYKKKRREDHKAFRKLLRDIS